MLHLLPSSLLPPRLGIDEPQVHHFEFLQPVTQTQLSEPVQEMETQLSDDDATTAISITDDDAESPDLSIDTSQMQSAPIFWLPPDILARILTHARDLTPIGFRLKRALECTWVCTFLRSVALSHPPLWNVLDDISEDWKSKFPSWNIWEQALRLSGATELDVVLNAAHSYSWKILGHDSIVQSSLIRSRTLSIVAKTRTTFRSPFSGDAPLLRTLNLRSLILEGPLFGGGGSLPRLQKLDLDKCYFNWGHFQGCFSRLTSLSIICPGKRLPFSTTVEHLANMPRIEELVLQSAVKPLLENDKLAKPLPRIQLPFLKYLVLHDAKDASTSLELFRLLVTGSKVNIRLNTAISGPQVASLTDGIKSSFVATVWQIRQLRIDITPQACNLHLTHMWPGGGHSSICLELSTSIASGSPSNLLATQVLQCFNLEPLESLRATNTKVVHSPLWEKIFRPLSKLQIISIDSNIASACFGWFIGDEIFRDAADVTPYPHLKEMTLLRWSDDVSVYDLLQVLRDRQKKGHQLPRLRMVNATFTRAYHSQLQAATGCLERVNFIGKHQSVSGSFDSLIKTPPSFSS